MGEKYKVIWTDEFRNNLDEIYEFLKEGSVASALNIIEKILSRERQLRTFPESGGNQESKKKKYPYKYLIEGNYKVIYHIEGMIVYVDTVFDTRQDPDKLKLY